MIVYQLGRRGDGWLPKEYTDWRELLDELFKRLRDKGDAPFNIWRAHAKRWSRNRTEPEVRERLGESIKDGDPGDSRIVRSSPDHAVQFMVRKREVLSPEEKQRSEIVHVALAQIGDDYSWGIEGPDAFDCSGLTRYCVGHATGIWLPHSAHLQMLDKRLRRFDARSHVQGGDLVFYDAGPRLSPGMADHVGIARSKDIVIDASSSLDRVVQRAIDSNNILRFGRLEL